MSADNMTDQEKIEKASQDFVRNFAMQIPGSFDFTEGTKCFEGGVTWRDANPSEDVLALVEALRFYANEQNYEEIWCEFGEDGTDGDIARLVDLEDCEVKEDEEGSIYYSSAGKQARTALARWDARGK